MLIKEPDDAFLNYALAIELEKENKITEAIAVMEKIIERDENYLGAYYKLGKLYEAIAQKEKAAATYQKGIAIARAQFNTKTLNELNEALQQLEE
ncbi:MAG TPA: tetratricopeptide repeat protein [Bacteroidia bacterium]